MMDQQLPEQPAAPETPAASVQASGVIPLTPEQVTYWRGEITRSRAKRKEVIERYGWDDNLKRYEPPKPKEGSEINLGVDFADVERKKAALLFDTPSVALQTHMEDRLQAVALHQQLLNTLLGPQHIDFQPTALQALFNCLCPSGVGPVVIGYSCTKIPVDVQAPVMGPDGQPQIDPLTQQPLTQPQTVDVPIAEKFYASAISPWALLLPADLRTTEYQKYASWMGWEWRKPVSQCRRDFNLADDWAPKGESEKPYARADESTASNEDKAGDPMCSGVELWYHADLQSDGPTHPDLLRRLVLVDGDEQPVIHMDSPHQTMGPDGRLTPDSMLGFPEDPLVLRDLTDSAWVPSDCAMTAQLTKEQQKYRTNTLLKRENSRDVLLVDAEKINPDVKDKILKGEIGAVVPVVGGALDGGINTVMVQVAKVSQGREAYLDQELIGKDRSRVLGMDSNQAGAQTDTKRTATESSIVQRNTDARFEQERKRVLAWFLRVVRKIDALVLRYADQRLATEILGPQKAQVWFQAKSAGLLAGIYTYSLQMDSGKYLDIEQERKQYLQVVNFAAKSPFVNQSTMWRGFCEVFGKDPTEWLVQPEPPKPEPPKMSVAIKGEDFIGAQGPIVLDLLSKLGYPIDAGAVKQSLALQTLQMQAGRAHGTEPGTGVNQPTHGGPADKAERIDQHTQDLTGKLPGNAPA